MSLLIKRVFVLFLCFALTACTSMQVVADGSNQIKSLPTQAGKAEGLHAGETLLIVSPDGAKQTMVFGRVEQDALIGTVDGNTKRVPFDQVERIERQEVSWLKTAGAVYVALGVVALFAVRSLFNDIGNKK